jgi:hypothetical protein
MVLLLLAAPAPVMLQPPSLTPPSMVALLPLPCCEPLPPLLSLLLAATITPPTPFPRLSLTITSTLTATTNHHNHHHQLLPPSTHHVAHIDYQNKSCDIMVAEHPYPPLTSRCRHHHSPHPPPSTTTINNHHQPINPSTMHVAHVSYQNKSCDIVRAEHPDWTNETQIAAQAAIEFDAAAKIFYDATIAQMRAIRPKAR